uniref:Uncharacterized protein n=1 Tax=Octopus bimaculoides TaxID=37653 RepID=A0A0L8FPL3_OCTBM
MNNDEHEIIVTEYKYKHGVGEAIIFAGCNESMIFHHDGYIVSLSSNFYFNISNRTAQHNLKIDNRYGRMRESSPEKLTKNPEKISPPE